ncbi:MAG: glycine-rich domain-containing protein, partial [Roseiflexaceae bacterium]
MANYMGKSSWPDAAFDTTMHAGLIYNTALSGSEISALHSVYAGRYIAPEPTATVTQTPTMTATAVPTCSSSSSLVQGYRVWSITTAGMCRWVIPDDVTQLDYLAVGAGGGGGYDSGGGGSGGQVIYGTNTAVVAGSELTVFVGSGGSGGTSTVKTGITGDASSVRYGGILSTALGGRGGGGCTWNGSNCGGTNTGGVGHTPVGAVTSLGGPNGGNGFCITSTGATCAGAPNAVAASGGYGVSITGTQIAYGGGGGGGQGANGAMGGGVATGGGGGGGLGNTAGLTGRNGIVVIREATFRSTVGVPTLQATGGTVVSGSFNETNTGLTASASVDGSAVAGGSAQLIDQNGYVVATDSVIGSGDATVTFVMDVGSNTEFQDYYPIGSGFSVVVFNANGDSVTSSPAYVTGVYATMTPTHTVTNTPTETYTPSNTPTETNTPSNTPTETDTPTETSTPSNSPTETDTPSNTPTETSTPSHTPTETFTPSNTPTETDTPSNTPTETFTPSNTPTETFTPSNTPTETSTPSNSPTETLTPSNTATLTPSN